MTIITELGRVVDDTWLMELSEIEQDLVCQSNHSDIKQVRVPPCCSYYIPPEHPLSDNHIHMHCDAYCLGFLPAVMALSKLLCRTHPSHGLAIPGVLVLCAQRIRAILEKPDLLAKDRVRLVCHCRVVVSGQKRSDLGVVVSWLLMVCCINIGHALCTALRDGRELSYQRIQAVVDTT
jgi:hypothetical protein